MILLDERSTPWAVMAGDPASPLINKLKRLGFEKIILTRYNYMTGLLDDEMPERGEDFLSWVRLHDCRKVLS